MGAITEDDYTMEHAFNTNIAAQYDVNIAVLLHNFKFWTLNNLANKRNIHEGLCWTYDTVQAFCEIFHYWTRHQIEHLLKKAEGHGLIVSGNLNQHKYDRTKWYALTPAAYKFYEELQTDTFIGRLYSSISPDGEMHKSLSLLISEKSEMVFEDFRNVFLKFPKPIPDTIPDKEKDISASGESPNIGYTEFDGEQLENEKSDYETNQAKSEKNDTQVIEPERNPVKSDYCEKQSKNQTVGKLSIPHELKILQEENIFSIPEQAILDWIANRKKKRVPITPTAWKKINKELARCKEHGIDPVEAFETFVANGWQSFKLEWFLKDQGSSQNEGKNSGQSNLKNYW